MALLDCSEVSEGLGWRPSVWWEHGAIPSVSPVLTQWPFDSSHTVPPCTCSLLCFAEFLLRPEWI
jgi:hypothetical protein